MSSIRPKKMTTPCGERSVSNNLYLVGGLEHVLFSHILGMSSSQLTNIGVETTNQRMYWQNMDFGEIGTENCAFFFTTFRRTFFLCNSLYV